jgi:hypothetical protein
MPAVRFGCASDLMLIFASTTRSQWPIMERCPRGSTRFLCHTSQPFAVRDSSPPNGSPPSIALDLHLAPLCRYLQRPQRKWLPFDIQGATLFVLFEQRWTSAASLLLSTCRPPVHLDVLSLLRKSCVGFYTIVDGLALSWKSA